MTEAARVAPTGVEYGRGNADPDQEKRILMDAGFTEDCAMELVDLLPGLARVLWELRLLCPDEEGPEE